MQKGSGVSTGTVTTLFGHRIRQEPLSAQTLAHFLLQGKRDGPA